MARGIRATTRTTPAPKASAPSRAKPKKAAAKTPSKATSAKAAAERPPMVSKGDLRAQVEKLEQTVATLRVKSREANRTNKQANVRIAGDRAGGSHLSGEDRVYPLHPSGTGG